MSAAIVGATLGIALIDGTWRIVETGPGVEPRAIVDWAVAHRDAGRSEK